MPELVVVHRSPSLGVALAAEPDYTKDLTINPPKPVGQDLVKARYTFAEAGAVVDYIKRATEAPPPDWYAAWPTFNADLRDIVVADPSSDPPWKAGGDPCGRTMEFGRRGYEGGDRNTFERGYQASLVP